MSWSRIVPGACSAALALALSLSLPCSLSCSPPANGTGSGYGAYPAPGAYPSNPPLQGPGFLPAGNGGGGGSGPTGGGGGPTGGITSASPGCGKTPAKLGASTLHVSALGRDRSYTLVVPDGYAAAAPYPLVFVLHGSGGTGAGARAQTDLEKVAGGHAVFVYPDAPGGWDLDAPASSNGDVALFDAILLAAHNALCIDPRRVFVTGFSNGAYMANQLGCKRGERIRAVATHSGGGPYETGGGSYDASGQLVCPGKAIAALIVHGNSDGTVPPAEGEKSVDHWSHANRCGGGTSSTLVPPCVGVQGCFQPVSVCRIPGLGHGLWSQAGKVTWSFFDALR
jgi:polyhydroxybutyrate depolymerase